MDTRLPALLFIVRFLVMRILPDEEKRVCNYKNKNLQRTSWLSPDVGVLCQMNVQENYS